MLLSSIPPSLFHTILVDHVPLTFPSLPRSTSLPILSHPLSYTFFTLSLLSSFTSSPSLTSFPISHTHTYTHTHTGNDDRYMNYVQDLKISVFETLIRSLAHGKLEIHRQFPKAESLKDCKCVYVCV
jgi:hypothetical protein